MDLGVIVAGLLTGGLYATIGLGLSLVFGVMKLVNLAHGELIVVGAYASSLVVTWLGLDPFLSLVLVVPVLAALAYPVQRYLLTGLLRRGLEPPLVATFGLSLVISAGLTALAGGDPRKLPSTYSTAGMNLFGQQVRVIDVVGLGIGVALTVVIYLVMRHTRWGAALRAASTDPSTAGTMGINVNAVYAITFAASAAVAAIGGVFIGTAYSFTPTSGMGYILIGFTVVVLGGTGSAWGTLIGGLVLGLVQSVGGALLGGQYRDFVIYAFFLIVLAAKPVAERVLDAARNRQGAIRHSGARA
ncbi:MAG TPA: branched-chain amino acid ABC transporter permease [Microbacteriaceae bacterium]|nr:branched-chain amino acid ABC transporter permease [Microbacteriaceae bacterium]